jgi:hypothetical protein
MMNRLFQFVLLTTTLGQVFAVSCPATGSIEVSDVTISLSNSEKLCTLTTLSSLGELVPVARSYDGNNWEASPGPFSASVSFECSKNSCSVDLTQIMAAGSSCFLTTFESYADASDKQGQKNMVARFLEQAT